MPGFEPHFLFTKKGKNRSFLPTRRIDNFAYVTPRLKQFSLPFYDAGLMEMMETVSMTMSLSRTFLSALRLVMTAALLYRVRWTASVAIPSRWRSILGSAQEICVAIEYSVKLPQPSPNRSRRDICPKYSDASDISRFLRWDNLSKLSLSMPPLGSIRWTLTGVSPMAVSNWISVCHVW